MAKVAIVGSGITGAVTAYLLKQKMPQIDITFWEKARGTGGRMCTSRSPVENSCTVDLGAQYISMSNNLTEIQKNCYQRLFENHLLKPFTKCIEGLNARHQTLSHYICSKGSGSIVKYFLETSGCTVNFNKRLTKISLSDSDKLDIGSDNSDKSEFDVVILTIPVPQILQLDGVGQFLNDEIEENLKLVKYNTRFAVGLFYNADTKVNNSTWTARYFENNSVIRFVAYDHEKRDSECNLPSVVVHSTKEFGKLYVESSLADVQPGLLNELQLIIPSLSNPMHVKTHKWRYSQVEEAYKNKPGCLILNKKPLLICGGDGFSDSTFEGCVLSAEKILESFISCK